MHLGISVALGKLQCHVMNCLSLKDHHVVFCQSVLAYLFLKSRILIVPLCCTDREYPSLARFLSFCPDLPLPLCSTGSECPSLARFLWCLDLSLRDQQFVSALRLLVFFRCLDSFLLRSTGCACPLLTCSLFSVS